MVLLRHNLLQPCVVAPGCRRAARSFRSVFGATRSRAARAQRVAMESVQHRRIVDSGEFHHAGRNWLRSFLVPQWRQSSRNGPVSRTLEDPRADLQMHHDRQRCTGGVWKRESTDVCPRVDSCNSRRNYADLLVGNGLTGRPAFSAGWRNIAIALIGLRRAPCKSRRLSLAVFSTVSRSADRAAHSLKDDGGRRHSDWS